MEVRREANGQKIKQIFEKREKNQDVESMNKKENRGKISLLEEIKDE